MISKFLEPLLTYQEQSPVGEMKLLFQGEKLGVRKVPATKGYGDWGTWEEERQRL